MKKLFLYVFLGLMVCYGAYADPVEYIDDWHLLDNTKAKTLEIKDSNGLVKITVQDKNLILTAKKQTSSIYQFNEDKFDIYLITKENNLNVIYIFNHTTIRSVLKSSCWKIVRQPCLNKMGGAPAPARARGPDGPGLGLGPSVHGVRNTEGRLST